jgi:Ca2+-binding EF-hand superfamily protein
VLFIAVVVVGLWSALAQTQTSTKSTKAAFRPIDGDAYDFVYLGGKQPVFVRVHVQIAGKTLATLRPSNAEGAAFSLVAGVRRTSQSADLFARIDTNHDGELSEDELRTIPQTLHKLDVDDDETIGLEELVPFRSQFGGPVAQPANASPPDVPFVLLGNPAANEAGAKRLVERFDRTDQTSHVGRLTADELGLNADAIAAVDRNADAGLDATELADWLRQPPAQVELVILFASQRGRPTIEVLKGESRQLPPAVATKTAAVPGLLAVRLGSVLLELRARNLMSQAQDALSVAQSNFYQADKDKNLYIDPTEFGALQLPGAEFKSVDANGDGMLFRDELAAFVRQQTATAQHKIDAVFSEEGGSLFELIDTDRDRRLSRRECRTAFQRQKARDVDANGKFNADELGGTLRLTFEYGRLPLFNIDVAAAQGNQGTAALIRNSTTGPEWFRKMDRNKDGDVSPREFLGPRVTFQKLDRDGDGLISVDEASQAP